MKSHLSLLLCIFLISLQESSASFWKKLKVRTNKAVEWQRIEQRMWQDQEKEQSSAAKQERLLLAQKAEQRNQPLATDPSGPMEPSASLKPKLIIIGAPGAGKGTQCESICEEFHVVHLSTGDILREAIKKETAVGKMAQQFLNSGLLVPDDVIIKIVLERLQQNDCVERGWLLDGFPRTVLQAQALISHGLLPVAVIHIDTPDYILLDRILQRRVDPVTGRTFHLTNQPPETAEIAARLIQRGDDTEDSLRTRLSAYHSAIASIKDVFRDRLHSVDGTQEKQVVAAQISSIINSAMACPASYCQSDTGFATDA